MSDHELTTSLSSREIIEDSTRPPEVISPRPTSFSFTAESLQQRGVPTKEATLPNKNQGFLKESNGREESLQHSDGKSDDKTKEQNENVRESNETEALFECNICLDTASQPVVTLCGHLYCWPCIHPWMVSGVRGCHTCPVCKSAIEKDKLIPIYTRGRTEDPRNTIPERPQGQRTESNHQQQPFSPFDNFLQGMNFTAGNATFYIGGFGLLPLAFQFASQSGAFAPQRPTRPGERLEVSQTRAFVSRMVFMLGIFVLVLILLY